MYYEIEWNCHHRNWNWNWSALGIWYRSRNWSGIAFIGIGIELQKRNWPQLWTRFVVCWANNASRIRLLTYTEATFFSEFCKLAKWSLSRQNVGVKLFRSGARHAISPVSSTDQSSWRFVWTGVWCHVWESLSADFPCYCCVGRYKDVLGLNCLPLALDTYRNNRLDISVTAHVISREVKRIALFCKPFCCEKLKKIDFLTFLVLRHREAFAFACVTEQTFWHNNMLKHFSERCREQMHSKVGQLKA